MPSDETPGPAPAGATSLFSNVPVEITVSVGHARPSIRELLELGENSVLALDRTVEAPVDLFAGDRLIGRGQLEESEDGQGFLAVRIAEIFETAIIPS